MNAIEIDRAATLEIYGYDTHEAQEAEP